MRAITSVRPGAKDIKHTDRITWSPAGAAEGFVVEIAPLFEEEAPRNREHV